MFSIQITLLLVFLFGGQFWMNYLPGNVPSIFFEEHLHGIYMHLCVYMSQYSTWELSKMDYICMCVYICPQYSTWEFSKMDYTCLKYLPWKVHDMDCVCVCPKIFILKYATWILYVSQAFSLQSVRHGFYVYLSQDIPLIVWYGLYMCIIPKHFSKDMDFIYVYVAIICWYMTQAFS